MNDMLLQPSGQQVLALVWQILCTNEPLLAGLSSARKQQPDLLHKIQCGMSAPLHDKLWSLRGYTAYCAADLLSQSDMQRYAGHRHRTARAFVSQILLLKSCYWKCSGT